MRNSISNEADLHQALAGIKQAQSIYSTFTQKQVDEIFKQVARVCCENRIPLAMVAVEETGMGVLEDKVIKNQFASEYIYNKYKDEKTCGIISEDEAWGIREIAEPLGTVAAIIPTTNPTSTAIFKILLSLKTRNGIMLSPHPRAKNCTFQAAKLANDAAVSAGAPNGLIECITNPTLELTTALIHSNDINLILATGGPGMVKAAYSSGKPAIGVGAGNVPVVIDEFADIQMSVSSILMSKTFDNGLICASEQSVTAVDSIYEEVKTEFTKRGAYILSNEEKEKLAKVISVDGHLNGDIVGLPAYKIAAMAGINLPHETKVLIAEVESTNLNEEPFAMEKLSPVLAMYHAKDYVEAVEKAADLLRQSGLGHTSVYHTSQHHCKDRIKYFASKMKTGRILTNCPSSQGAIGDVYNFKLAPSLTLGCGSWGGNAVSENVGVKHLLNIKTQVGRRENMQWFKVPPHIYFKFGSMELALKRNLKDCKRAFIVTDKPIFDIGTPDRIAKVMQSIGCETEIFFEVTPDPTISIIKKGVEVMNVFQPDVIIAVGGGSPMDAAKMMWVSYEHPEVQFKDLALRFMDILKRICPFPEMGEKAKLVTIPTTSGTGSEVTPFAVVTDDETGMKYPLADYQITPYMAIIDPELVISMPRGLTANSGIDALTHALEAYVSILATDFTNSYALQAIKMIFEYLPASYKDGATNFYAKEKMHYAATMAGMAFANAFLGICHSMAHKLGAKYHLPHGMANALMINEVIKFNSSDKPTKQAAFAQYKYPNAKRRYAEIAEFLGLGGKTDNQKVEKLIEAITKLKQEINLPLSIREAGVNEADFMKNIDQLSLDAFDDQCTGANPRYPLISELKEIYIKSYNG